MGAAATLELPEEKTRHGDSDMRLPGIFTPDFSPFRKQKSTYNFIQEVHNYLR